MLLLKRLWLIEDVHTLKADERQEWSNCFEVNQRKQFVI